MLTTHTPIPGLDLLPLTQPKTGFHDFISSWLMRWEDVAILVDPGPSNSIPLLLEQLHQRGIQRLDGILLTHIHIDHAGGTGHLIQQLPVDWIQCHNKGIPHLIDPTQLWQGSLKVLGDLPELYGPIAPIPPALLQDRPHITLAGRTIEIIQTPGHAPHHQSFVVGPALFAGEAAGVVVPCEQGPYMRPATPPRFIKDIFFQSIQRLLSHPSLPRWICYGHYGWRDNARKQLQHADTQLTLWCDLLQQHPDADDPTLLELLRQQDPLFQHHHTLPHDLQQREHIFLTNSLRGIRRFFARQRETNRP